MPTRQDRAAPATATRRAEALDDALDRLSTYDYVDGPGMAVHAPMAAEALSTLGHDDLVAGWVEDYKARHAPLPAPPAVARLDAGDETSWRPALGDVARLTDWADLFARELADAPWRDVVATWVPHLLAGYGGAFTHGLVRTAHAVRAIPPTPGAVPSPLVVDELATALAYWAGTYLPLPGRPALAGELTLDEALARMPRPAEPWAPIEAAQFSRIRELSGWVEAVEALAAPASVDEGLSDLTSRFARALLANPDVHPFGLVHAVTPVAGARTLLPYLPAGEGERVYAQLWHVDAAIAAGFLRRPGGGPAEAPVEGSAAPLADVEPPAPAELAARAAEHGDPHVVKFTEACLREHALRPDPAYLLAARRVADVTPAW